MTQAAAQAGVTLTEFVTAAAEARARRVISGEVMYPDAEQSRRVAELLRNPGEPNAALRDLLAGPHHQEAAELLNASPPYVKHLGSADGALAEYPCASEKSLTEMPTRLSFEQAAAIPMAGLAALHGLRDAVRLLVGQRLLVNGASGGIGTFAIQIAKVLGAEVTAVCSGANVELVRELGADHVIDYTVRPLTEVAERFEVRYDVILDNVANHSLGAMRRLLTPTGTLVTNSGEVGPDGGPIARILKAGLHALRSRQTVKTFLSTPNRDDLAILASLVDAGEINPVIDRVYPLDQAAEAMVRVASRHARGKVVVMVAPDVAALPG